MDQAKSAVRDREILRSVMCGRVVMATFRIQVCCKATNEIAGFAFISIDYTRVGER
jgi:hypothetical protein